MFSGELAGWAIKFVGKELLLRGSSLVHFFLSIIDLAGLLAAKAGHVCLPTITTSQVLSWSHSRAEVLCSAPTANLAGEWAKDWDIAIIGCSLVNM